MCFIFKLEIMGEVFLFLDISFMIYLMDIYIAIEKNDLMVFLLRQSMNLRDIFYKDV